MHADEVETGTGLVRRLVASQFPAWAGLPVAAVTSYGTGHAIYRLGDGLAVRLLRVAWAESQAAMELEWLPRLAPHLPLALPVPVALGRPAEGYPFGWSVYEWLPGAPASEDDDPAPLAGFLLALRAIGTAGAPPRDPGARGGSLATRDEGVRRAVAELGDRLDGASGLRAWEQALEAPAWTG